ncbi:MAG TPA: hypothetical protein PLA16_03755 [Chitinophagales bacterium]|jgi:hypothetical protein|nr:hypothetical protein [Chitinophagales bacterium]HQO31497.1 hypothetical protein [Chitinophagales bacterium]
MTRILSILLMLHVLLIESLFAKIDLKNKNFKHHELGLNINYSYHNSLINNTSIIVRGIEDNSEILNEFRFRNIVLQGVGLKLQYNYFIKKRIYVGASLNTSFYFPQTIYYDLTDALNKIPPNGTKPIISTPENKIELTYNAQKFYTDIGIGFLPVDIKQFNWRIATGIGVGYRSYSNPFSGNGSLIVLSQDSSVYKYYYKIFQTEEDIVHGLFWGGYLESALNFITIKDKLEIGINYKFFFGKVPRGLTFPHDVGIIFNLKLK